MSAWIALLRRRPHFRRLWLSGVISLAGDFLSFVAIATLALESSEGPIALAITLAVHQLPAAILGAFAGTVVDRVDRRKLLIAANVAQAVLTVIGASVAGVSVFAVQAIVLGRSAVSAFILPTETAALRRVVQEDELADANALFATTWSMAFVVGMALGGFLAQLGATTALLVDSLTFVFAVAMAWGLPSMVPDREVPKTYSMIGEVKEALALTHDEPRLWPVLLAKIPPALAWGAAWLALHLLSEETMPFGPTAISIGIFQSVRGVGTGVGPILANRAIKLGSSPTRLLAIAMAVLFFAVPLFVTVRMPLVMLVAVFLWGSGSGASWVISSTLLQKMAGDARIGRLSSLDELFNVLAMQLSAFLAAVAVTYGASAAVSAIVPLSLAALIGIPNLRALSRASRPIEPLHQPQPAAE